MEITLGFDESLMRRAKAAAEAEGSSLDDYIADAVREKLSGTQRSKKQTKRRFPVGDTGGLLPGVPPIHESRVLNDYLDEEDGPQMRDRRPVL